MKSPTTHRFELKTEVNLGAGARLGALEAIRAAGVERCGVVIDEGVAGQDVFRSLLERDIPAAGLHLEVTLETRSGMEPDYDYLDSCTDAFRGKTLDVLFGIGGGSAMDLAKGIAILLKNPGKGIDYRGMDKVPNPGISVVLFPTTAGTGSEVTATAAFIDNAEKVKLGINGRHVRAWRVVLDPVLTAGCPRAVTISSGMDALVHTVESFTANTTSPLARDAAFCAFGRLFNNLARVVETPDCLMAREQMTLGAYQAGVALWNAAGGGPASAISYPVGVLHRVPHGFAGGLVLPHVIRFNEAQGYRGYEPLYALIEDRPGSYQPMAFEAAFEALYRGIDAPRNFSRWGVTRESIPRLVGETTRTRVANLGHNPIPFAEREVQAVLESMMDVEE